MDQLNQLLTSDLDRLLFFLGAGLYTVYGLVHVLLVLWDERRARLFLPDDPELKKAMKDTTLRLSRRLSLLETYRGLNLSHGLGVLVFGLICALLAWNGSPEMWPAPLRGIAITLATANSLVALRYWPGFPAAAYVISALAFWASGLIAWL